MTEAKLCYWCHEPLPSLPEDASYVDEINHYIHDGCRDQRDELDRRREQLERQVDEGLDNVPVDVREHVLALFERRGFARRCPCLYDPEHGFAGYGSHTWGSMSEDGDEYDRRNAVGDCDLCGGSGEHDPLPELVALRDDVEAAEWVAEHFSRGSGPAGIDGWYYNALGYARHSKKTPGGVRLFNYDTMQGGTITYAEIGERFRPRIQTSLF